MMTNNSIEISTDLVPVNEIQKKEINRKTEPTSLTLSNEICDTSKDSVNTRCNVVVLPFHPLSHPYKENESYSHNFDKISKEALEEVKVVTNFLSQYRSREAARNLLHHQYISQCSNKKEGKTSPSKSRHKFKFSKTKKKHLDSRSLSVYQGDKIDSSKAINRRKSNDKLHTNFFLMKDESSNKRKFSIKFIISKVLTKNSNNSKTANIYLRTISSYFKNSYDNKEIEKIFYEEKNNRLNLEVSKSKKIKPKDNQHKNHPKALMKLDSKFRVNNELCSCKQNIVRKNIELFTQSLLNLTDSSYYLNELSVPHLTQEKCPQDFVKKINSSKYEKYLRANLGCEEAERHILISETIWENDVFVMQDKVLFGTESLIKVDNKENSKYECPETNKNNKVCLTPFSLKLNANKEKDPKSIFAALNVDKANSLKSKKKKRNSLQSTDRTRSAIIQELLNTEQDFVKTLVNIEEGFIAECKKQDKMFTSAHINSIFGNLEDLLAFQKIFLKNLKESVNSEFPHKSCVGKIFLKHIPGFLMYSEYCNTYSKAVTTLKSLCSKDVYKSFFEKCRKARGMIGITLDGYLLTPVQRICRYPLLLSELVKYTNHDHPDYETIRKALYAMKKVVSIINGKKKSSKKFKKINGWAT